MKALFYLICAPVILGVSSIHADSSDGDVENATQEVVIINGSQANDKAAIAINDANTSKELAEARRQLHEAAMKMAQLESNSVGKELVPLVQSLQPIFDSVGNNVEFLIERSARATGAGFLGVEMGDVTDEGVLISSISADSAADEADLQEGDVIVSINGLKVTEVDNPTAVIASLIALQEPGSTINLEILRDDQDMSKSIALGDKMTAYERYSSSGFVPLTPQVHLQARPSHSFPKLVDVDRWRGIDRSDDFGILALFEFESDLRHFFGQEYGVVVLGAPEDDLLEVGDILLSIDGQPVRSISHAARFMDRAADEEVNIRVKRRGREKEISETVNKLEVLEINELIQN